MPRRPATAILLGIALVGVAPAASAAPTTEQIAAADHLFQEGLEAMPAGDYAKACPKLQKSLDLDPATGTKLNLAHCYEAVGRTASAWSLFNAVAAEARRASPPRPDRVKTAEEHAAALQGRLAYLTVVVPAPAPAGLAVTVDGVTWLVGEALPADPGPRALEATAPGKLPVRSEIVVGEGARVTFTIPPLADAPAAPPPPPPPSPRAPEGGGGSRGPGVALVAVGVASLATGAVFGALALSKNAESEQCGRDPQCTRDTAYPTANTFAWVADVTIPVGIIAGGLGAYFLLTRTPGGATVAVGPRGVGWSQPW